MLQRIGVAGLLGAACLGGSLGSLAAAVGLLPSAPEAVFLAIPVVTCLLATTLLWLGTQQQEKWRTAGAFILVLALPVAGAVVLAVVSIVLFLFFDLWWLSLAPVLASIAAVVGIAATGLLLAHRPVGASRVVAELVLSLLGLLWFVLVGGRLTLAMGDALESLGLRTWISEGFTLAIVDAAAVALWAGIAYTFPRMTPAVASPNNRIQQNAGS